MSRTATRITSRANKLAKRKVADRECIAQMCDHNATRKLAAWLDEILQEDALMEEEMELWEHAQLIGDTHTEYQLKDAKLEWEESQREVEQLEEELRILSKRESSLDNQLNMLADCTEAVIKDTTTADVICNSDQFLKTSAASRVVEQRFTNQLEKMEKAIEGSSITEGCFMNSQFDDYITAELEYTESLTKFCEALFFDGISKIPGGSDHDYISQDEKIRKTIRRVQDTFLEREESYIADTLHLAAADALNNFLKSSPELEKTSEEISLECVRLENGIKEKWQTDIVPLLLNLRSLQDVSILSGNYKLKLLRQDFFTKRQDKVIELLLHQLSRQELLQQQLEHEYHVFRDQSRDLSALDGELERMGRVIISHSALVDGDAALLPKKRDISSYSASDPAISALATILNLPNSTVCVILEDVTAGINSLPSPTPPSVNLTSVLSKIHADIVKCDRALACGLTSYQTEIKQAHESIETYSGRMEQYRDDFTGKFVLLKGSEERKLRVWFFTDEDKIRDHFMIEED